MIKRKMICAHCKGEDVVVDAWAEWSVEQQQWVLRTAFDAAYCIDCESACDVDEVEIEDLGDFEAPKGTLPLSMDNVPPIIAEHVISGADMGAKNNG